MTYDEFEKKYIGKAVDYDGVAGVQCVDLVDQYLDNCFGITGIWCDGAEDLYNNYETYPALVKAFDRVPNTRDLVIQKGDIVIWGGGSWGHTGIGNGEGDKDWFVTLEENTLGQHEPTQLVKHRFDNDIANPCLGVLRPKEMSVANSPKAKTVKTRGVDISECQGTPDFAKLKNAVDFVIIKAGYGRYRDQVDPQFERNYAECKKYGIPCGAYWFGYATNPQDAASEARICAEVLKGKKFEYPIYYDMETDTQSNHYPFNTGIDNCSAMVEAFCSTLESYGYFAGLYISRSPLQQYIYPETAAKYSLWIAEYGGKCNYTGTYGMWQYSDNGSVSGIAKAVDLDECYVDYPKIVKEGGFNGYPEPEALKELDKLSEAWWKHGDKLDHGLYAVKARMKSLGYGYLDMSGGFGGGTEKAVNDLLRLWGYKQNGVIGKKFVDIVMK